MSQPLNLTFSARFCAPRLNFEKVAVTVAITALVVAIVGAIPLGLMPQLRIGLGVGGGMLCASSVVALVSYSVQLRRGRQLNQPFESQEQQLLETDSSHSDSDSSKVSVGNLNPVDQILSCEFSEGSLSSSRKNSSEGSSDVDLMESNQSWSEVPSDGSLSSLRKNSSMGSSEIDLVHSDVDLSEGSFSNLGNLASNPSEVFVEPDPKYLEQVKKDLDELKDFLLGTQNPYIYKGYALSPKCFKKFYPFFSKCGIKWQDLREELKQGKYETWDRLVKKVYSSAYKAYPVREFIPTWVTGNRSSALIGMGSRDEPALVPSGLLLEENIPPLSGELCDGIFPENINDQSLSGCTFKFFPGALKYAKTDWQPYDCHSDFKQVKNTAQAENPEYCNLPRLKIAVLRLIKMQAPTEIIQQAKNYLREFSVKLSNISELASTDWKEFAPLIGRQVESATGNSDEATLPEGKVVGVLDSDGKTTFGVINGLYTYNQSYVIDFDAKVCKGVPKNEVLVFSPETLRQEMKDSFEADPILYKRNRNSFAMHEVVQEILQLFDTVEPYELSPTQQGYWRDPFPILWGSTQKLPLFPVRSDIRGEYGVKGIQTLGREIDLVFTKQSKIKMLRAWLREHHLDSSVTVLSFGVVHYMYALRIKP